MFTSVRELARQSTSKTPPHTLTLSTHEFTNDSEGLNVALGIVPSKGGGGQSGLVLRTGVRPISSSLHDLRKAIGDSRDRKHATYPGTVPGIRGHREERLPRNERQQNLARIALQAGSSNTTRLDDPFQLSDVGGREIALPQP